MARDLISRVTDALIEDAKAWQQQPLDELYQVVFLDALELHEAWELAACRTVGICSSLSPALVFHRRTR